jgi:hypothetical protein
MVGLTSEKAMSVRESWVYPSDGGEPYLKGSRHETTVPSGVQILPDLPDFVSPIDGKLYSGRAGLREHCRRHDVVPNAELKGLPTLQTNSDFRSPAERKADAAHRKEQIIRQVNQHYR